MIQKINASGTLQGLSTVFIFDASGKLKFNTGGGGGGGTVTSIATTGPITGGTITTTGTIGITQATTTTDGYLSSIDWNTFDGKFDTPTGTILEYIRGDGSLATFPSIPTVTPAALTKTDDTNVTLTLGGSPSTSLLQATSLTLGWTGTLADGRIASAGIWTAKQDALVSGTNIKTINGNSLLGSGNLTISGGSTGFEQNFLLMGA